MPDEKYSDPIKEELARKTFAKITGTQAATSDSGGIASGVGTAAAGCGVIILWLFVAALYILLALGALFCIVWVVHAMWRAT